MKAGRIGIMGALLLSACAAGGDDYPRLLPTEAILAEPTLPDHVPDAPDPATIESAAASRAEGLRQRADALRGPVIEPEILSRMGQRN